MVTRRGRFINWGDGNINAGAGSFGIGYISGAQNPSLWDTQSVLFDGIQDWASSSYNSDIFGPGTNLQWSYAWWLRKNGSGAWGPLSQTIIARWFNNTGNVFRCLGNQTVGRMGFFISTHQNDTGGTVGQLLTPPTDELWHHYAMVYSGTTGTPGTALSASILQVYVDGVQQALTFSGQMPATSTLPTANIPLTLGRGASTTALYFSSGAMDEVAFFNRALTGGEVADVYNAGNPIDIRTITSVSASLRGYWAMGENHSGPTIPNLVSGSAFTLMNGTAGANSTGSIEERYSTNVP